MNKRALTFLYLNAQVDIPGNRMLPGFNINILSDLVNLVILPPLDYKPALVSTHRYFLTL